MRVWECKLYLARHLGVPLGELGRMAAGDFLAMVAEVEFQRRVEQYPISYRLGQIMCILTNGKAARNKPEHFIGNIPTKEVRRRMGRKNTFELEVSDSQTYVLTIMNANMMEAIETEYGKPFADVCASPTMGVMKRILLQVLLPLYPDMDLDRVGILLNPRYIPALAKIITEMLK